MLLAIDIIGFFNYIVLCVYNRITSPLVYGLVLQLTATRKIDSIYSAFKRVIHSYFIRLPSILLV